MPISQNRSYSSFREMPTCMTRFQTACQRAKVKKSPPKSRAVFTHKAISNITAENICKIFENYKPLTQTRYANAGRLNIPSHTYAKYKKCPTYRCIKTWNNLPDGLPEEDIRKHKKAHQKYLIEKQYPQ